MTRPAASPDAPPSTGRRALAWSGVVLILLGVLGVLLAVVRLVEGAGRPVVVLLAAVGVVAVGADLLGVATLGVADPAAGASEGGWTPVPAARRPVLLVNPGSGGGARTGDVVAAARSAGIDVRVLGEGASLAGLAAEALRNGADCLGVAGGDGSLAEVAAAAAGCGVPFVCVPSGTHNHFALDLGIDRADPVGALAAFGPARQRTVDLGDVNGRPFLNNVSMGAYGEVVADEHYRDHKVGVALSRLPDLVGPHAEPRPLDVADDRGERVEGAVVVHVSNNAYDLAPRPGFGTRPSLSDGLLGVVVVGRPTLGAALRPAQWTAPEVVVASDGAVRVGIDGEATELAPPVRCSVRPGVLGVRIPPAAPGRSPAAARVGRVGRAARRVGAVLAPGFTSSA